MYSSFSNFAPSEDFDDAKLPNLWSCPLTSELADWPAVLEVVVGGAP
jgi:hypothetical protein